MSKELPEVGILPDLYERLHISDEVHWAAQTSKTHVPNDRDTLIANYLDTLDNRHGLFGGDEERRQAQVRNITHNSDNELLVNGLTEWTEYINSDDAGYPIWYRYLVIRGLIKMGSLDREQGKFKTRSKSTRDPYPELNAEALALVYSRIGEGAITSFNNMYASAILELEATKKDHEIMGNEGSWTKYNQDPDGSIGSAGVLTESLKGYNTSWCTARGHAPGQLRTGDFYVFYSTDENGEDRIPRLAIRMQGTSIGEIRGVARRPYQGVEPELYPTVFEKLESMDLNEKDRQNLEQLKVAKDGFPLLDRIRNDTVSIEDIKELYFTDFTKRQSLFGFSGFSVSSHDLVQAASEWARGRSFINDMAQVFESNDHTIISERLAESHPHLLRQYLSSFENISVATLEGLELTMAECDKSISATTCDLSGNHMDIVDRLIAKDQHALLYKLMRYMKDLDPALLTKTNINSVRAHTNLESFTITELDPILPYVSGSSISNKDLIFLLEKFPESESHFAIIEKLLGNKVTDDLCRRVIKNLEHISPQVHEAVLGTLATSESGGRIILRMLNDLPLAYHEKLVTEMYSHETGLKWILSNLRYLSSDNQVLLVRLAANDNRLKRLLQSFSKFHPEAQQVINESVERLRNRNLAKHLQLASVN